MRRRVVAIGVWVVLLALAALIAGRARYTADLSAFLPRAPTRAQQFLVDQLRDGSVSRLILIAVEGADGATRARLSRELAVRLRADPAFRSVMNGEWAGLDHDRAFVVEHRYLLSERVSPERFSPAGLAEAIRDSIELLSSAVGVFAEDLFVRDPTGESLQVLLQLEQSGRQPRVEDGLWVSHDAQRALLLAETRAAGSDSDGQERATVAIREAFAAIRHDAPAALRMTGPGVFAVEARATIEHEVIRLSIISSLLIAAFLLLVYRSLPMLLFGLLPVVSGALAGVAAVAIGFGVVHGVTLGFGVTLIGEAVDYSVYFFIQSRHGGEAGEGRGWIATLWPTIRLGMLTSVCGFASLLPSAFAGLAQLGLYSIAGLVAAGLVTRFVLPEVLPRRLNFANPEPIGNAVSRALGPLRNGRAVLWLVPLVAAGTLYAHRDQLWNRDLSALSPVPAAEQALDAELRADLGAPDVRTLVVLTGENGEAVLRACEALRAPLDGLVAAGSLGGYQTPSRFLPSRAVQTARRASLPPRAELIVHLGAAVTSLPVRAERFTPFVDDVEAARKGPLLSRADFEATSFAAGLDALFVRRGERWHALLPLAGGRSAARADAVDVDAVARAVRNVATPGVEVTVLDLKREADALYSGYLAAAIRLSLLGLAAIVVLLLVTLRSASRVARVIAPLVLAVLAVVSALSLAGRTLTILHLIGLLLVVAIGSNYALFFDRQSHGSDRRSTPRMLASLLIANLATVMAFGVLSFSTVPVLSALGSTVAPGTLLALVFSAMLASDAEPRTAGG
jgi:predicted exporter